MRIGFFDSGIGGVSVLTEAMERIPGQEWIFYADVDHVPYGEKSAEEIRDYAVINARFLLEQGAEAIVVACNTATAVAIGTLRAMTEVPVIGMEPAVKPAVEGTDAGRVLVAATPVTLREAKLKDLIRRVDSLHRVDLVPLPGLVLFAEREQFDGDEVRAYLAEALAGIDPADYSALVMGCTHFIYFIPLFRELLGARIRLVDGNEGTVRRLADLTHLPISDESGVSAMEDQEIRWYLSGRRVTDAAKLTYFGRLQERIKIIKNLKNST